MAPGIMWHDVTPHLTSLIQHCIMMTLLKTWIMYSTCKCTLLYSVVHFLSISVVCSIYNHTNWMSAPQTVQTEMQPPLFWSLLPFSFFSHHHSASLFTLHSQFQCHSNFLECASTAVGIYTLHGWFCWHKSNAHSDALILNSAARFCFQ